MQNQYCELYEGQQVIIRPDYRDGTATATIISFNGSSVITSEGIHHASDLADDDSCPESWLDEQALEEIDLW